MESWSLRQIPGALRYDYEDEVCKMKLDALKDEIKKCGYRYEFFDFFCAI